MRWRSDGVREDGAETTGARRQLGWFTTLYAMALVFHYSDSAPLVVVPVLVAALPALLFPSSLIAVGLVLTAGALIAVLSLPAASNHQVMSLLVALALGAAALWVLATRRQSGSFVERWLDAARSPIGLVLLVVYAFTVFDKLNTAFFDPPVSCGGRLFRQLLGLNGFGDIALHPVLGQFLAVATVVVEAAILGLVAVPRLRRWGVLLGVCFHSVLAMASFYDFSTIVFALYVLLTPAQVFADVAPRFAALRRLALAGFGLHVLLSIGSSFSDSPATPIGLQWHTLLVATWFVAVGPFMYTLVRGYFAAQAEGVPSPGWRLRPALLLLVPLLAFVNGATPYLGLKTVANYSMFSNLHTEEWHTNHLVPGVMAAELADYQRDAVDVTGLELPDQIRLDALHTALGGMTYLRRQSRWVSERPPVRIPWLELRRTVLLWQGAGIGPIRLAYVRDGARHVVPDATADPVLAAPLPWWQRHLLAFRAVDSGLGADHCRW